MRRAVPAVALLLASAGMAVAGPATAAAAARGVGVLHVSFTEERPTPADGSHPALPQRTLDTTILYPAQVPAGRAPVARAAPARAGAPYPLIVFAHGFGEVPQLTDYTALLRRWAAAGFVVAAPVFPLTNADAPGGPDLSDYVHQPGDMSTVITGVLGLSRRRGGILHGLVDAREVGAAGHSLGGVTVLGLVADSCCRDPRVKAAVVMSGDPISFPGHELLRRAPPLLLVHGSADPVVPYVSSIDVFNRARAPKGLLTIVGGGHNAPVDPDGPAFGQVVAITTAFFTHYLVHPSAPYPDQDTSRGAVRFRFVARRGEDVTLPVPRTAAAHLSAGVTPHRGLGDGQVVTVRWRGYARGAAINVLECSVTPPTAAADCNLRTATLLHPDPDGSGTLRFTVHTGPNGSGRCDATHDHCVIVVNEGGSTSPDASTLVPISFGTGAP